MIASQAEILEKIKILLIKSNNPFVESLDFDDDDIFREPLLFAYFNNQGAEVSLESILFGYIKNKAARPTIFSIRTNDVGIAFIPRYGYFHTAIPDKTLSASYHYIENKITLSFNEDSIAYDFEESVIVKHSNIELLMHRTPLLKNFFRIYARGESDRIIADVEIDYSAKSHLQSINKAMGLIKDFAPAYYLDYIGSNRSIVVFNHPHVVSFVTLSLHGAIFLTTNYENNEIFFIEELIHQGSHNYLNALMYNKERFFKIDVEKESLGKYTENTYETRTIYSALHGLYTVAKRVELFEIFYANDLFTGRNKHELIGRFCDQFRRFRTGLQKLDLDSVFTAEGKAFYEQIDQKCYEGLVKRKYINAMFHTKEQPQEFSYNKFVLDNPFHEFMKIERQLPHI